MYQHQILGVRTYTDKSGQLQKATRFLDRNWRADSLQDILINPEKYLAPIPPSEHNNLFVTMAKCIEGAGRKLAEQWVIPFDIDEIIYERREDYAQIICDTLGVVYNQTGILFTGNGLHILIGINLPILDEEFFKRNRMYYDTLCMKIRKTLEANNLPFKDIDTGIFKPGIMTRIPTTQNIKPNKPTRRVEVLNPFIVQIDFDLKERSGLTEISSKDALTTAELDKEFKGRKADTKEVLSACPFMVHAQKSTSLTERQWYNALSIASHLDGGMKICHDISKHDPRYNEHETKLKAEQAFHRSGPMRCSTISQTFDGCQKCPHFGKVTSPILLKGKDFIATAENGFRAYSEKGAGKINYVDLIKFYRQTHTIRVERLSGTIFVFNGKFYERQAPKDVEAFAYAHIKHPTPMSHEAEEFRKQLILYKPEERVSGDWFTDSTNGYMNFTNGVLDLGSFELLPHSPDFGFTGCVPFDYNPDSKCPLWEHTINKVTISRNDLKSVLQEFAGYILSGSEYRWHKALVLTGGGRNGKSTIMELMAYCIGEGNYSSLPFRLVVQEKENLPMAHKLANFTEETGVKEWLNVSAQMKNLISGGKYTVRDLYQKGYEIKNRTKFVLACNELPKTNDTTKGFIERLIIVPFDAYITKESDPSYDPYIHDKLKLEASGIINWMIEGYKRLVDQNGFTTSEELDNTKKEYLDENDAIRLFFQEEAEVNPSGTIAKSTLYESYRSFCTINGLMPKSNPSFYKQLKTMYPFIEYKRARVEGSLNPLSSVGGVRLLKDPQF